MPRRLNERAVEYAFVFHHLGRLAPRTVLDVGTGTTALPALLDTCGYDVTAIDNVTDYWPKGMENKHWDVLDDDIRAPKIEGQFDAVVCVSVIEHILEYYQALDGLAKLTKPGGHIIMTCPYNTSIGSENCYSLEGSYGKKHPYICRQLTRPALSQWLERSGVRIVAQEWWQVFDSDVWSVGKLIQPPEPAGATDLHQHTCLLLKKGDENVCSCRLRRNDSGSRFP